MVQMMITPEGYTEIKGKIREKLNETVNNFIIIGYYLKQVRDNMLYQQDGYKNMEEFAMGEYKLSAATASRFMDINTQFSVDGNSLEIKSEYGRYGYSKLQEMLTMKPEDRELVSEETTVRQIREIKALEKEEERIEKEEAEKNLPLMQMAAAEETEEEVATSQEPFSFEPFEEAIFYLWKGQRSDEMLSRVRNEMISPRELAEYLSPSGSRTFWHKTYMIVFYTYEKGLKFRFYAEGMAQIEDYSYSNLMEKTCELFTDNVYAYMLACRETEKHKETVVVAQAMEKSKPQTKELPKEKRQTPPPVVEKSFGKDIQEKSYQPLPGQATVEDIGIITEPAKDQDIIDAECKEVAADQAETYSEAEVSSAVDYFETEHRRMLGTGLQESAKCRNYKMALYAIKNHFARG